MLRHVGKFNQLIVNPKLMPQYDFVKIVEVGPRDGLQNIKEIIPTAKKVKLINKLSQIGLRNIEITSFVSPKKVPQMSDSKEVSQAIKRHPNITYSVLIPNEQGLQNAIKSNIKEIEIFTSASEEFCKKNLDCDIETSFKRFKKLIPLAKENNIRIRGCVSCIFEDPYSGPVDPNQVIKVAKKLYDLGCDEIVLADTTGVGYPDQVNSLTKLIKQIIPINIIAYHFHNTHRRALPNVLLALQNGIRIFDSSIAGLGGCPYAKNATGNIATEDLVYLLNKRNCYTGINFDALMNVVNWIYTDLGIKHQAVICRDNKKK